MKKIKLLVISIILFSQLCNAQKNIVVVDKETNEPIPFASLKFTDSEKGIYTNEKGVFSLENIKTDSLEISYLGYKTQIVLTTNITDTLKLVPKPTVLSEVFLTTEKPKLELIGYSKKSKNMSWFMQPKQELTTLINIPVESNKAYVSKIHIPIGKHLYVNKNDKTKRVKPDFNSVFRLHLYSNKNNQPNERLLKIPLLVYCNQDSKKMQMINIEDKKIIYPKEGLFVGVEMIGNVDENGYIIETKVNRSPPTFKFTKRAKGDIKSYTRFMFSKTNEWHEIDPKLSFNKKIQYHMAVGLTIVTYKE